MQQAKDRDIDIGLHLVAFLEREDIVMHANRAGMLVEMVELDPDEAGPLVLVDDFGDLFERVFQLVGRRGKRKPEVHEDHGARVARKVHDFIVHEIRIRDRDLGVVGEVLHEAYTNADGKHLHPAAFDFHQIPRFEGPCEDQGYPSQQIADRLSCGHGHSQTADSKTGKYGADIVTGAVQPDNNGYKPYEKTKRALKRIEDGLGQIIAGFFNPRQDKVPQ